jgi:hypothetical protein
MTKFLSFIAIAAFALSASSVEAAKKKPQVAAASSAPVQTSAPVQNRVGPAWMGNSNKKCQMSGRC